MSAEDIRDVESSSKTFSLGLVSFISQMGFSGKTENRARNCLTFECDSITSCKGYEGCSIRLLPVTVWLSHFSRKSPNTNYSLDCWKLARFPPSGFFSPCYKSQWTNKVLVPFLLRAARLRTLFFLQIRETADFSLKSLLVGFYLPSTVSILKNQEILNYSIVTFCRKFLSSPEEDKFNTTVL